MVFLEFLTTYYWFNTGEEYLISFCIFFLLYAVLWLVKKQLFVLFKKLSEKTSTHVDDFLSDFLDSIRWPFFVYVSLYVASRLLILPEMLNKILWYLLIVQIICYAAKGIGKGIRAIARSEIERRQKIHALENTSFIRIMAILAQGIVWVIALLMVLANFGVDITPLVASLGIGGVAIALASQAILGDLFSAFAIYFDKPFKEGDFIIIGTDMGVVKNIGIKTTRIQTLQGQELVVSNSELTSTRINNYKRMEKRRIEFKIGVTYDTSLEHAKKINEIIATIVKSVELVTLDRVHFKNFGDFSLIYEIVYYLESSDYGKYMDVQQEINFKIKEAFEKEGIDFAFPTQTIILEK